MGKLSNFEKQLAKKVQEPNVYEQVKLQETQDDDFNVAHLIQTLEQEGQQIDNVKNQYIRVNEKARIVSEPESKAAQEQQERKVTAIVMKQDIKKWLPIVKKNRESTRIDFTKQRNLQIAKISDTSNALKNNHLGTQLQQAMEEVEYIEQPQTITPDQQKKSNLQFYQDLKLKRIAKIKSKIYKQIKRKKNNKEKMKLMAQLTPVERRKELEKIRLDRAKERITLRHSTKNKFVSQLLRFGADKTSLKQQQSFINNIKQQLLAKAQLNELDDGEFDEDNFREQAIDQLEKELQDIERREKEKSTSLGFLDKQKKQDLSQSKTIAQKLLTMLKTGNEDAIQVEESYNSDDNYEPNKPVETENNEFNGRATYINENQQIIEPQKKKIDSKTVLNNYLNTPTTKEQKQPTVSVPLTKEEEKKLLIDGLNIKNIKQKYEKQQQKKFTTTDLKKLNDDPDDLINQNLANFNLVLDEDENENAFVEEKIKDMEDELPPEPANLKGWGSWAGFGIKEKKPLTQEQILQNKIKKIRELQKKRKDAKLDNVIISEKRDSKFAKYLVPKLPHEFNNPEQFDHLHSLPIGPEWNSLTSHSVLIEPKIITKAGVVINPVKVPQQVHKLIN